jgi:hypothetical protein
MCPASSAEDRCAATSTLNDWFRQVCRRSAGWGVLLASVVLICACSAATSSTAPPPPATAGTSATSVAASSPSPATSAPPSPSIPARIVANKRLGNREQDLTIESPALGGQVNVRLLLPAHYETEVTLSGGAPLTSTCRWSG